MALRWQSPADCSFDVPSVVAMVNELLARDSPWLVHPALGVISDADAGDPAARTAQFVAFLASRASDPRGWLEVPPGFRAWSCDGPVPVLAGRTSLKRLRALIPTSDEPHIALDPEALASGIVEIEGWAADDRTRTFAGKWDRERSECATALDDLREHCAAVFAWVAAVAPVVTPLFNTDPDRYRSWSWGSIPGTVFIDTHAGRYAFLESLVHEAAHRHFLLAEANAPLSAATGDEFHSPLRREPRPIRAVLFAYHALAYMSAFHPEYERLGGDVSPLVAQRLSDELREARSVLRDNHDLLTPAGAALLARTDEVAHSDVA